MQYVGAKHHILFFFFKNEIHFLQKKLKGKPYGFYSVLRKSPGSIAKVRTREQEIRATLASISARGLRGADRIKCKDELGDLKLITAHNTNPS
jgi:hypothetical protein